MDNSNSLEKRFFEHANILQFALMSFLGLQTLWRLGWTMLVTVDFSIALVGLCFYYLSTRGHFHKLRFAFIGMLMVACIYFWMTLGGFDGTMGIGAPMIGIVAIIIIPKNKKLVTFIFFIGLVIALNIVQYSTDLVIDTSLTKEFRHFNYVLLLIVILYITFFVKSEYDKEKSSVKKQNVDLITLNQNLEQVNHNLENTLNKLSSTQGQLVESEKMASIGRMTSALAHELNNPLNYVLGGVNPILTNVMEINEALDEPTRAKTSENFIELEILLKHLSHGASKISSVIANLVKISSDSTTASFQSFDLSSFLREHVCRFKKINTNTVFTEKIEDKVVITGHSLEIMHAVNELLLNAVEAESVSKTKEVCLTLRKEKEVVIIEVSNNGIAINPQIFKQIFDPFFSTKDDYKHSGLGLYYVYGVAKKHGGSIKHLSQNGQPCFRMEVAC